MTDGAAEDLHDLDHHMAFPRLAGLTMSPDGSRLVTTVTTLDEKRTGYVTALWEVDPSGARAARRLTRSAAGEGGPTFSASGDLWFTSCRPGETGESDDTALWRLPAEGGEATVVNRRPGGINQVICARSADVTVVTAPLLPGASDESQHAVLHGARTDGSVTAILHDSYPVRSWDHDLGPARSALFTVDEQESPEQLLPRTEDGLPRRLRHVTEGLGSRFGGDVTLSPDGTRALISVHVPEPDADRRTALALVDLVSGERRMIADDPDHDHAPGPFSPDGRRAVVTVTRRPVPSRALESRLHLLDLETGGLSPTADADLWLTAFDWLPDGSGVIAVADADGRGPLFRVDVTDGAVSQLTHDDATYSAAVVSPDGAAVLGVRSSYAHPSEVVRVELDEGSVTRLRNPVRRPELPGTLTEVETHAEDGVRVRAWLALPEGASPEDPAPLLLWIHGGPLSSWNQWSWRWNPWLMVARGYAVLLPDPALSTGYGQEFIQRGWNSWGEAPFTDLMAITDAAEARPDIDQTRTAAMGGSFGGYMANWVAGHTDRFSAIVTHASLWALDQFGPTTDASFFWRRQIDTAMEQNHSPHRFVEDIVTPMLVIHGDKDYRVPIGEGLRLWYELLEKSGLPADAEGNTVHRFLHFPQENHWILTPHHAKIWYEVVLGFLAEHVLGESRDLPAELGLTPPTQDD
ncbi:S9 family peptidase [Nesterenkonia sp. HG001]|uniref:S9 family peptidase n=1 Tax=Nesterenkonia sp. HG001 TaxID=2983207 RepID=UPI002AC75F32|nr:S9 family peptidase [Nesterenkonia sp. HG001]MDZ5076229.1 S9 family peptidase [Nesterenkonia sp. HG001]